MLLWDGRTKGEKLISRRQRRRTRIEPQREFRYKNSDSHPHCSHELHESLHKLIKYRREGYTPHLAFGLCFCADTGPEFTPYGS